MTKYCFKIAVLAMLIVGITKLNLNAQNNKIDGRVNTVYSAIPFLRINPDGRSGAMGDAGIAISTDPGAMFHNASKLAFAPNDLSFNLTYTPWLRELVDDIYIAYGSGYKRIDKLQAIGLSLRYFSLGTIQFTDNSGGSAGEYSPNEFAIDLAYARKLSDNFSTGITLKYTRSDLASGYEVNGSASNIAHSANAVAADISVYYQKDLTFINRDAKLSLGAAVTNVGNKVSYTEDDVKDFIPINLGIGSALKTQIDEHNSITIAADINKLLVPTPDTIDVSGAENIPDSREKPLLSGMFGSFSDAPDGFSEEIKELMYSVGLEYWYNDQFALRLGHFNEHKLKGNRKFFSVGLGLRYSVFGLNFSYIIPANSQKNPLDNTMRFSLLFNFDGNKDNK